MKSLSKTPVFAHLNLQPVSDRIRPGLVALLPVILAAGCHNYTATPVCTADNIAVPPGMTGTYTLALQDEEFNVTTQEFRIETAPDGRVRRSDGGEADGQETTVCQINGHFIEETYEESVGAYSQARLYVTAMGITQLPVFYDKTSLDAAGIANKIFEVPATARDLLGQRLTTMVERAAERLAGLISDGTTMGLLIDNRMVDPRLLLRHGHAGPVGVTLLRR